MGVQPFQETNKYRDEPLPIKDGQNHLGSPPQKCQWIVKVQREAKKVKLLLVILAGGLITQSIPKVYPSGAENGCCHVRDGGHIRPYPRGHIRPYPKRGHIRPYPTILPIDCVIEPFRVRPGDKGLLGGTGEHLGGTWGRSLSHFPHY